jgi:hypothetical protein
MAWVRTSVSERILARERLLVLSEATLNNSSKDLAYDTVIGEGVALRIDAIRVLYAASGDAGTRKLKIRILKGTDVLREISASFDTTISGTTNYEFAPGLVAGVIDGQEALPEDFFLLPGEVLRVLDSAAIAAGADDMDVRVHAAIEER